MRDAIGEYREVVWGHTPELSVSSAEKVGIRLQRTICSSTAFTSIVQSYDAMYREEPGPLCSWRRQSVAIAANRPLAVTMFNFSLIGRILSTFGLGD